MNKDASLSAFQDAFMLMGVMSLIGVGVALLIRDRDAESTMHSRTSSVDGQEPGRAVAMH